MSQASSGLSHQPTLTSPDESNTQPDSPSRLKCYCTIMDWRARYIHNGYKNIPCDGTICANRRVTAEALATEKHASDPLAYLVRDRRWPLSTTALVG